MTLRCCCPFTTFNLLLGRHNQLAYALSMRTVEANLLVPLHHITVCLTALLTQHDLYRDQGTGNRTTLRRAPATSPASTYGAWQRWLVVAVWNVYQPHEPKEHHHARIHIVVDVTS
jgi:hypothetical protein